MTSYMLLFFLDLGMRYLLFLKNDIKIIVTYIEILILKALLDANIIRNIIKIIFKNSNTNILYYQYISVTHINYYTCSDSENTHI